jgi:hypothetical protein
MPRQHRLIRSIWGGQGGEYEERYLLGKEYIYILWLFKDKTERLFPSYYPLLRDFMTKKIF